MVTVNTTRCSTLRCPCCYYSNDLRESLSAMDDHVIGFGKRIPEGYPLDVSHVHSFCVRAGALSYHRESGDSARVTLGSYLPMSQLLSGHSVECEFCGKQVKPSLDLTGVQQPEEMQCNCAQQQLQEIEGERGLFEGEYDLKPGSSTSLDNDPDEFLFHGREMDDPMFIMYLPRGIKIRDRPDDNLGRVNKETQKPADETSSPKSKVLSFRLASALEKGSWTLFPSCAAEEHMSLKQEEEQMLIPFCSHKPLKFGLCHHQDSSVLKRNYSNGQNFLTVLPDGSAQVLYPLPTPMLTKRGVLAVIVVTPEESGRICIVYDDTDAQPIRAIFQSDGRATCYHNNRNIWLNLTRCGGQCLDEKGAKLRRWNWTNHSLTPTPMHPIFLSLNKFIGVRVLGREQVFVSFLAGGQQAKFGVGSCCPQDEAIGGTSGPSLVKEELFECAARLRINWAFQHLHLYWQTRAPRLHAQRLLAASDDVIMSKSDREFIHWCLRDFV